MHNFWFMVNDKTVENVVYKMEAILFMSQCANLGHQGPVSLRLNMS